MEDNQAEPAAPQHSILIYSLLAVITVLIIGLVLYFQNHNKNASISTNTTVASPSVITNLSPTPTASVETSPTSEPSAQPTQTPAISSLDQSLTAVDADLGAANTAADSANNAPADTDTAP